MTTYICDRTFPEPSGGYEPSAALLAEARALHERGLSPIPLRPCTKRPYGPWSCQHLYRIHSDYLEPIFTAAPSMNLGLVVGAPSRNLVALDCDTPAAFDRIGTELDRRAMKTWVRSSRRGGHFLFLCLDGEITNENRDGYQVLGRAGLVVVPPSVLADPNTGQVLPPVEWLARPDYLPLEVGLADLDWLNLSLARRRPQRADKGDWLPPVAERVLLRGDITGYRSAHSGAEYAAVLSLAGAGYDEAAILSLFRRFAPPYFARVGEEHFVLYTLTPALAQSARTRDEGDLVASRTRVGGVSALCDRYAAALARLPFPGATGNTDKAVLGALCHRMRLDGSLSFRASVREVAEIAGIGARAANLSLRRLQQGPDPYLVHDGVTQGTAASRWRLNTVRIMRAGGNVVDGTGSDTVAIGYAPVQSSVSILVHSANVGAVGEAKGDAWGGDTSADVWARGGAGKAGRWVWDHLLRHPEGQTVAEIRAALGVSESSVRTALKRLAAVGLASCDAYAAGDRQRASAWYGIPAGRADLSSFG